MQERRRRAVMTLLADAASESKLVRHYVIGSQIDLTAVDISGVLTR